MHYCILSCIMLDLWCQIHTCLDLAIWKPTKLDVWVILEYAAAMTAGDDILQLPSCPNERSHSAKWPHARKHGNVTKSDCASHVEERHRKETHQNNAVHQNYMRCVWKSGTPVQFAMIWLVNPPFLAKLISFMGHSLIHIFQNLIPIVCVCTCVYIHTYI